MAATTTAGTGSGAYATDLEAQRGAAAPVGTTPLTTVRTTDSIIGPTGAELQPEAHRRNFRQFANPAPLGLCAFALTTFVLSLINVNTRSLIGKPNIVIGLAFFYGGVVQILAGMWEMAVGNTFGATALTSYGGFWLSFAAILTPSFGIANGYTVSEFESAIGVYLMGWFVFTFLLWLCTFRSTVAFFALFGTLTLTFLLLGIGYFKSIDENFVKAGGAFGIIAALMAWYCALAGLLTRDNSFFLVPTVVFPWASKGTRARYHAAATEKAV